MKENVKLALRKVFDAGMMNQKLHPDDDSYDDVNFEKALTKKEIDFLLSALQGSKTKSSVTLSESEKQLAVVSKEVNPKVENGKSDFYLGWRKCFDWIREEYANQDGCQEFKEGDWAAYNWLDDDGNDNWKIGRIVKTNGHLMYHTEDGTDRCGYIPISPGVKYFQPPTQKG